MPAPRQTTEVSTKKDAHISEAATRDFPRLSLHLPVLFAPPPPPKRKLSRENASFYPTESESTHTYSFAVQRRCLLPVESPSNSTTCASRTNKNEPDRRAVRIPLLQQRTRTCDAESPGGPVCGQKKVSEVHMVSSSRRNIRNVSE